MTVTARDWHVFEHSKPTARCHLDGRHVVKGLQNFREIENCEFRSGHCSFYRFFFGEGLRKAGLLSHIVQQVCVRDASSRFIVVIVIAIKRRDLYSFYLFHTTWFIVKELASGTIWAIKFFMEALALLCLVISWLVLSQLQFIRAVGERAGILVLTSASVLPEFANLRLELHLEALSINFDLRFFVGSI